MLIFHGKNTLENDGRKKGTNSAMSFLGEGKNNRACLLFCQFFFFISIYAKNASKKKFFRKK